MGGCDVPLWGGLDGLVGGWFGVVVLSPKGGGSVTLDFFLVRGFGTGESLSSGC